MRAAWVLLVPLVVVLAALLLPPAKAVILPTCETEIADQFQPTSALLRGRLIDNGGLGTSVNLSFKFGTSPTLAGASTFQAFPATSSVNGAFFNRTMANLQQGTTYYYATICTNIIGPVQGTIVSFTTTTPASNFIWVFFAIWIFLAVIGLRVPGIGALNAILGYFLAFELYTEFKTLPGNPPPTLIPLIGFVLAVTSLLLVVAMKEITKRGSPV